MLDIFWVIYNAHFLDDKITTQIVLPSLFVLLYILLQHNKIRNMHAF